MQRPLPKRAAAVTAGLLAAAAAAETFRIEIDYMGDPGDGHDHRPPQVVIDAVVQMFACQGHTLIIDVDDEIPHYNFLTGDPSNNCAGFFSYSGAPNTYTAIRDTYRDQGAGWHYALFAHQYRRGSSDPDNPGCIDTGSSGLANGGDKFIVTLGAGSGQTGTLLEQAGTLAHEFGHNLGLSHCGGLNCGDSSPHVQNLPSVMTYAYQLVGVRTGLRANGLAPDYALFKDLDYSHGRMCSWDENALDEPRGTRMQRVDFNCDDDTADTGVSNDLGHGGTGSGSSAPWCGQDDESLDFLFDYNEWANIEDGAQLVAGRGGGDVTASTELARREAAMEPCISYEEWERTVADLGLDTSREMPFGVEACLAGENIYVGTLLAVEIGVCTFPYASVQSAHAAAPAESVFYLEPRTYAESGTTTLSKPGTWSCNTGTARIE